MIEVVRLVSVPGAAALPASRLACGLFLQRLDGSIKGEIRKQALDHFNADGSEVRWARLCSWGSLGSVSRAQPFWVNMFCFGSSS